MAPELSGGPELIAALARPASWRRWATRTPAPRTPVRPTLPERAPRPTCSTACRPLVTALPGPVGAALAMAPFVELICDGIHVDAMLLADRAGHRRRPAAARLRCRAARRQPPAGVTVAGFEAAHPRRTCRGRGRHAGRQPAAPRRHGRLGGAQRHPPRGGPARRHARTRRTCWASATVAASLPGPGRPGARLVGGGLRGWSLPDEPRPDRGRGSAGRCRPHGRYLPEPLTRPRTRWRCARMPKASTGTSTTLAAAAMRPQ